MLAGGRAAADSRQPCRSSWWPINKGQKERILCVASGRDLARELPAKLGGGEFSRLPVRSLDEVASAYSSISGTPVVARMYDVVVR